MSQLEIKGNSFTAEITDNAVQLVPFEVEPPFQLPPSDEDKTDRASCCYLNAGTCPDCGGGMVRLGSCFSCPLCGYQNCGE